MVPQGRKINRIFFLKNSANYYFSMKKIWHTLFETHLNAIIVDEMKAFVTHDGTNSTDFTWHFIRSTNWWNKLYRTDNDCRVTRFSKSSHLKWSFFIFMEGCNKGQYKLITTFDALWIRICDDGKTCCVNNYLLAEGER